jgi:hypothetical protein
MTSPDDETTTPTTEEVSSSERVGPSGPGQVGTDGLRDTSQLDTPVEAPPEQSPGGEEPQPDGLEPKAGYPLMDPRHEDKPYRP